MADKDPETTWPPPRANPFLLGQEAAEAELMTVFSSGRLPHAWLIGGQGGVGKATLAFRFARFLFAKTRPAGGSLHVDESLPVFRRVAASGHADLLTIERQFDEERGRHKKEIAVDDVRRIAPFLRLTAAEGGWRIVIVDGAEDMNRAGQNAVLKILEEPPRQALILLLTERPSSLLPTIRSRCRPLMLPPLPDAVVSDLIMRYRPDIAPGTRDQLASVAAGSIGRALEIARHDGVSLLSQFLAIAGADPVDWPAGHALGDRLSPPAADESYQSFSRLLMDWLSRVIREGGRGAGIDRDVEGQDIGRRIEIVTGERELVSRLTRSGRLEHALEVWEKVAQLFTRSESANLDRRLTVISALDAVSTALR
jgi:DNA polymerase-3 subunit delta'